MASIEYRGTIKDGRHRWRVVDRIAGRKVYRTFYTQSPSKRTAEKASRPVLAELAKSEAELRAARGSVAELTEDWYRLKVRDRSPTTLRSYRRHADRLIARYGTMQVGALEGKHLDEWYHELLDAGWSSNNVHHLHRVVRAVLTFGRKKRKLVSTAIDEVSLPEFRRHEISPPTPAALRVLLAGVDGEWGRVVRLLAATGLRRGEVVGLQWADVEPSVLKVQRAVVDLKGGGVLVKEPKGKRSRTVHLTGVAAQVLAEQWAERRPVESPWVFPSWRADPSGRVPRSPSSVSTQWQRHRDRMGAPTVRLHDLRHAFATIALDAGASPAAVSAQLGHAQVSTTMNIYASATSEGAEQVVNAIDRALGPASGESSAP